MSVKVSAITGLNLMLLLYLVYGSVIEILFTPDDPRKIPYEILLKDWPFSIQMLGWILLFAIWILGGAYITRQIWNTVLAEIIAVRRQITFGESILIIQIIMLLKMG